MPAIAYYIFAHGEDGESQQALMRGEEKRLVARLRREERLAEDLDPRGGTPFDPRAQSQISHFYRSMSPQSESSGWDVNENVLGKLTSDETAMGALATRGNEGPKEDNKLGVQPIDKTALGGQ